MTMILRYIKRFFRVEYRLTTISRGKSVNRYCQSRRQLKAILASLPDAEYWTIYKSGPFGLNERAVDFGQRGEII